MNLTNEILSYIDSHADEALALLMELAKLPAPSNHEERRAEFCAPLLVVAWGREFGQLHQKGQRLVGMTIDIRKDLVG